MYILNFEIPAFLLSLLCFVYSLTAKRRQYIPPKTIRNKLMSQHFVFLLMLLTNMLSSVSSVVGVYLTTATIPNVGVWQYLFHAFYFVFHATLSVVFTLYIINVTGTSLNWKKPGYILFSVPYAVSELLILTNSFTHWAFYMDENLVYHRGSLMILLYALGVFYVAMGFIFFFKNKKAISRVDSIAVGTFIIIATLGIVIQAIWSSALVELFSESLACLVIMIVLEDKSGHVDSMTGLLNRVAFTDANRRMMNSRQKYALCLIRMTDLERISNRYGIREADELVLKITSFLVKESEGSDCYLVSRGSFAVLFKNGEEEARRFADTVLERFGKEWNMDPLRIRAEAIATTINVPEDVRSLEDLENLLAIGYQKTRPGSFFVPAAEIREITLFGKYESALKKALADHTLRVWFQPIWSVRDQCTVSAEALLRVDCDELRDLSPGAYVPVAEKTGLIRQIGLFVFEEVCRFLSEERIRNSSIRYVELNLSAYQFYDDDLVESFETIRKKYGVDSSRINLEITETAAASGEGEVSETLSRFLEKGYTLSLDDFGTGYSNLIRMTGTHYKNIKIDKSILWNISRDGGGRETLVNLIRFVKGLGSEIIQEGVETTEELDLSVSCGCDYIQGYHFGRPVPEDAFVSGLAGDKEEPQ